MNYIKRPKYIEKLDCYRNSNNIKVITGARRVGKSTLLFELYKNHLLSNNIKEDDILEYQLDNVEHKKYHNAQTLLNDVEKRSHSSKKFIFIDEVQYIKDFEVLLNSLVNKGHDVHVTSSNSKLLSYEINTVLRGRTVEIKMYPLSYLEIYSHLGIVDKEVLLDFYLKYGGLPEIHPMEKDGILNYLRSYDFDNIYKDVTERYSINKSNQFQTLVKVLNASIGTRVSAQKIAKIYNSQYPKVSVVTILNYIRYMKEANIIFEATRYDVKDKKIISTQSKYYSFDLGVSNSFFDFRPIELKASFENLIYLELLRRYQDVYIGQNDSKEIDFVVINSDRKYYIQVSYDIIGEDTYLRECLAFKGIDDGFKKIIITRAKLLSTYNEQGICFINVFDFLLNDKALEQI